MTTSGTGAGLETRVDELVDDVASRILDLAGERLASVLSGAPGRQPEPFSVVTRFDRQILVVQRSSTAQADRALTPSSTKPEIVAALRNAGMSTRAIGAATGVSHTTVEREFAGGTSVPPDPDDEDDAPEPAARVSDDELLAALRLEQERRGVLASSVAARERRVRALMRWARPRNVLELTGPDIEGYLDELGIGLSARRGYLSHFHAFFSWAAAVGHLETLPPTAKITRPKQRIGVPRPIPDAELAEAVRRAPTDRIRQVLLLAAYQGLRAQEIAGLRGEDVDRAQGLLRVRLGKGGKERILAMHPAVAEALPDVDGPLFPLADGRPPQGHNISHVANAYLRALGTRGSLHSLRHWHASKLYQSTQDLLLVQKVLGHNSPVTTAGYAAFDSSRAGPAVAALAIRGECAPAPIGSEP